MNELVEVYGLPRAIRLDNGTELTSYAFTEWAEQNGVELRFIQPGKPNQNAFIERFNKSFRQEVLDANLFNTLLADQELADEWLKDYNECRPHESLGNLPPAVFKPRVFKSEISTLEL
jgi:putative transposase